MSDFVIEKDEDAKIPKIEIPSNLDSNFFEVGSGNIVGKNIIQEFFNCTGTLFAMIFQFLKESTVMGRLSPQLFLNLKGDLFILILPCKDCFISYQLQTTLRLKR
jgi:hypothetical protein